MLDYVWELVDAAPALTALAERLQHAPAIAVDIETINWWNREAEKIALLQLAFRDETRPRVAVVDPLAIADITPLHAMLAESSTPKAIHNAGYDAPRLLRHYRIHTAPIHDTMLAARRSGERRCSLKAQVEAHLGLQLDKTEQRSDWGRRPLAFEQLRYAALDAACTLLLYELQIARGLRGEYRLRAPAPERQTPLPLADRPQPGALPQEPASPQYSSPVKAAHEEADEEMDLTGLALLGIVYELGGRYSPEQLAASVGPERVGLAGWIIDRALGRDADLDEGTARDEIARLCEQGWVRINAARRLEAIDRGARLWRRRRSEIES
ncbi:MAG: ribonuclease D [Acidobacteria bacterium]|nr:ribonuclease D [Acidobacteriota bacterium]MCW5968629.1 ribonuclease D [Blastocatellales bacterium]